jgi:hypothetical protein
VRGAIYKEVVGNTPDAFSDLKGVIGICWGGRQALHLINTGSDVDVE